MSTFTVTVKPIRAIEPHPDADTLELAVVDGYQSVIRKGSLAPGDLIAYIPEGALLPDPILERLGMKGSSLLAGAKNNKVKAIRLRGYLSQGICYPVEPDWVEGQDVAELLGIIKYEPPIPIHLSGQVRSCGLENVWHFDIENIKAFPDVLVEGEEVVFTEKAHGTWMCVGAIPGQDETIVSSKGLFAQGLAFKHCPENDLNLYLRVERAFNLAERIRTVFGDITPIYVLGEALGVQDLNYGVSLATDQTLGFRIFDIYVGPAHQGSYLNDAELEAAIVRLDLQRCPVLYRGPFTKELLAKHTSGSETISGKALHMREGLVVAPVKERRHPALGRVKLKSVSPEYLLRKNKNATEYE
jgi:RNA ligase (TIGR02306 family)